VVYAYSLSLKHLTSFSLLLFIRLYSLCTLTVLTCVAVRRVEAFLHHYYTVGYSFLFVNLHISIYMLNWPHNALHGLQIDFLFVECRTSCSYPFRNLQGIAELVFLAAKETCLK
jgi:hypothetical protein